MLHPKPLIGLDSSWPSLLIDKRLVTPDSVGAATIPVSLAGRSGISVEGLYPRISCSDRSCQSELTLSGHPSTPVSPVLVLGLLDLALGRLHGSYLAFLLIVTRVRALTNLSSNSASLLHMMASAVTMKVLVATWAALSCLSLTAAQSVSPSNGTLPVDPNSPQLVLSLSSRQMVFDVDPLTIQSGLSNSVSQLQVLEFIETCYRLYATNIESQLIKITGNLVITNSTSVSNLQQGQLAFVSCDNHSYPGPITASQTITIAAQRLQGSNCDNNGNCNAGAIILYSMTSSFCNYSPQSGFNYATLYTTTNSTSTRSLLTALTAIGPAGSQTTISLDQNSINNNSTSQQDALGPSPTTAVAMIILYSITGIITALFLTIIITGAVRAHRHPERYGPRNIVGRTRQTRAKGIARAMLESLPIVKFGEQAAESNKNIPSERDIELGHAGNQDTATTAPTGESTDEAEVGSSPSSEDQEGQDAVTTEQVQGTTGETGDHNHDSGLACSVCTDEFIKGQNVRVLPCNHKFHPECIDPWLLNVSGTCPLWYDSFRVSNLLLIVLTGIQPCRSSSYSFYRRRSREW